jgi:hypothetical protein
MVLTTMICRGWRGILEVRSQTAYSDIFIVIRSASAKLVGDRIREGVHVNFRVILAFLIVAITASVFSNRATDMEWNGLPFPESESAFSKEVFQYRMKGSVRLLFFWIGKDNVGGGTISRITQPVNSRESSVDGFEVLFGSDPEAVPGNHNRWGYARELAYWTNRNGSPEVYKTVFEGFMSKSSEESIDAVKKSREGSADISMTTFEGAVSEVTIKNSSIDLWRFPAAADATYKSPSVVALKHLETVQSRDPDVHRDFENQGNKYEKPIGFITAIRLMIDPILKNLSEGQDISDFKNTKTQYTNSARLYSLHIRKVKLHRDFELDDREFKEVVEIDFRTLRHENNNKHDFTLWIPSQGPFQGVPVKVADKPRWWLKVELIMDFQKMDPSIQTHRQLPIGPQSNPGS